MTTTIELKRAEAVTKLGELNKITPPRYSARDLRPRVRPMLQRVGRIESRRYQANVMVQKKKLTKDIQDIDIYLQSVQDYEVIEEKKGKKGKKDKGTTLFTTVEEPVAPVTPVITFGSKPVLRKTRIKRHTQRKRFR